MFLLDNLGLFDAFFLIRKERIIKLEGGVDDWHRIGEGRDQIEQRRRGIICTYITHTHTHTHTRCKTRSRTTWFFLFLHEKHFH